MGGPVKLLASLVLDFDIAVDSNDNLHLAYLQSTNKSATPAGIYYQRSTNGGSSWSPEAMLYQSLYFRALTPAEAHVEIAIGNNKDNSQVFVVWDNRPRGRIFLTKSVDGGNTWAEPIEVNKPAEGENGNPVNIHISIDGSKILLVWQSGTAGNTCELYYQWSLDGGQTWPPTQKYIQRSFRSPTDIQILQGSEGPILLLLGDQSALLAWNGTRWSDLQVQSELNFFVDPETGLTVNLGCQQAMLVEGKD